LIEGGTKKEGKGERTSEGGDIEDDNGEKASSSSSPKGGGGVARNLTPYEISNLLKANPTCADCDQVRRGVVVKSRQRGKLLLLMSVMVAKKSLHR
jgi:hypothetical protein